MKKIFTTLFKLIRKVVMTAIFIGIFIYAGILLPMLSGYRPLVVKSGSMSPTYEIHDIVYFKPIAQSQLHENDVIVYEVENKEGEVPKYVMHRITRIEDGQYYTQGDANSAEDSISASYSQIKGKVISYKISYIGKYVLYSIHHRWTIILPIIICILDFLIPNIYDYYKKKRNN